MNISFIKQITIYLTMTYKISFTLLETCIVLFEKNL